MFNLYLLSVIGLVCLGANVHSSKLAGYGDSIETETTTVWDNQLNISQITTDNDPKTHFILSYDVQQDITLPGLEKTLNINKLRNVDAFDKDNKTFTNEVSGSWTHTGGRSNVTLKVEEKLEPKTVDFSNPHKRSVFHYGVVIRTDISSVYDKEAINVETVRAELPTLKAFPGAGEGPIALSNSTGIDATTCVGTLCASTTVKDSDVKRYEPFGNVVVYATRYLDSTVEARESKDENGNTVYTRVSTINLDYYILIGFNNPK
ncbi:unnamed protein product [Phyllotreta striolata]|uniref:Uncharacterized protein n=1 Tax=Phyllotreta striolata TaxID=444603 RepID=A0A9N9TVK8_PHYSR|nr:unnamed protein product [Phyllotreta striolata]